MPCRCVVHIRLAQGDVAAAKRQGAGVVGREPVAVNIPPNEVVILVDRNLVPRKSERTRLCQTSLGVIRSVVEFGRGKCELNRWCRYRREQALVERGYVLV